MTAHLPRPSPAGRARVVAPVAGSTAACYAAKAQARGGEATMNQGDLADAVAAATGARQAEAAKAGEAVLAAVRDGLKRGERVAIAGIGSFEAARREAREGRNPRTGAKVRVAASTTVRFKPGK